MPCYYNKNKTYSTNERCHRWINCVDLRRRKPQKLVLFSLETVTACDVCNTRWKKMNIPRIVEMFIKRWRRNFAASLAAHGRVHRYVLHIFEVGVHRYWGRLHTQRQNVIVCIYRPICVQSRSTGFQSQLVTEFMSVCIATSCLRRFIDQCVIKVREQLRLSHWTPHGVCSAQVILCSGEGNRTACRNANTSSYRKAKLIPAMYERSFLHQTKQETIVKCVQPKDAQENYHCLFWELCEPVGEIPCTLASNQVEQMNTTAGYVVNRRSLCLHELLRERITRSYLSLNWTDFLYFHCYYNKNMD
jgi:hypothetical protein